MTDQTTTESLFYATKERDALIEENRELRKRIETLETEKSILLKNTLEISNLLSEQLDINQESTEELNETNDEIISVFKKLYKGASLSTSAYTTDNADLYFGLSLKIPLDLDFKIDITALHGIKAPIETTTYLFGISYTIF